MARSSTQLSLGSKVGFLCGWLFFLLAFVLAAAEATLAHGNLFTTTNDLLVALSPGKWIAFKARYDSALLDLALNSILLLPGWLLAGLPAGLLIWTCRPHREAMDPDLYHSLTTFDRLAEMAEEEGAADDDPTFQHYDIEDYDTPNAPSDMTSARAYMKDWHPENPPHLNETDTNGEAEQRVTTPKGPQERMDAARDNLSIPFDKLS